MSDELADFDQEIYYTYEVVPDKINCSYSMLLDSEEPITQIWDLELAT